MKRLKALMRSILSKGVITLKKYFKHSTLIIRGVFFLDDIKLVKIM